MSGIAAIYDPSGAPVSREEMAPLVAAIAHRGQREDGWSGPGVRLAVRLLPTTPEALNEKLPLQVAGGRLQVALDGRIDNRDELAGALGIDLAHENTTDAELIALAYERWDVGCLERLIGDFAFVLWDDRARRIFAARDQRGFRPLVYARAGRRLLLGSEARQLLAYPDIAPTVDQLFLACHLTGAVPPPGVTSYAAVSEVPPAYYLVAAEGEFSTHEYWRFRPRERLHYRRSEEYAEHFQATFDEAIKAVVRAPSAPAVLLSGGLDSSYVTSRAAAVRPDVRAYSAYAAQGDMDERRHSRAVAEELGVDDREVPVDDCWSLSSRYLPDAVFDQPNVPMQAPLMVRLAQAAGEDGVSVVLDGMGGDEFLTGPSEYLADLAVVGRWLRVFGEARQWASRNGRSTLELLRYGALAPLLPAAVRAGYRKLRGHAPPSRIPPWIDVSAVRAAGLQHALGVSEAPAAWQAEEVEARFWEFHLRDALPVILWRERRASLPAGVETRSPFWDLRVVELMLRIPSWVHRDGGQPKALLRAAMRPGVPPTVVERNDKATYDGLMNLGLFERESGRVSLALEDGPLSELLYVRGPALVEELISYRRYQHPWWHPLWRAVTAGLWLRGEDAGHVEEARQLVAAASG